MYINISLNLSMAQTINSRTYIHSLRNHIPSVFKSSVLSVMCNDFRVIMQLLLSIDMCPFLLMLFFN